jgi:crossover junction endodeoxyribonuclease RuvC
MPTRVLGLDPGIAIMGYGIIDNNEGELTTVGYGVLTTTPKHSTPERLRTLYEGIIDLIECHEPTEVAVELFVARNLKTALIVGQARGVALLAAANKCLPVYEYSPLMVKQKVTGYGRGEKRQVQEMVRMQLGLDCIPEPDDAADALAVAICHISEARLSRLLANSSDR